MVRKFVIENSIGDKLDLQIANERVLIGPSGLGLTRENVYADVSGSRFLINSEIVNNDFAGTIMLDDDTAYDSYFDIIEFFQKQSAGEPYVLKYTPRFEEKAEATFSRLIILNNIDKGEVSNGRMQVPIRFNAISRWFTDKSFTALTPILTNAKIYAYDYGYVYGSGSTGEVLVENKSSIRATAIFTVDGEAANPKISIYTGNNYDELDSEAEIFTSVALTESLILDTRVLTQSITHIDSNGNEVESTVDTYQRQNFDQDKTTFLTIPSGVSKIVFGNDVLDGGRLSIVFREERNSV